MTFWTKLDLYLMLKDSWTTRIVGLKVLAMQGEKSPLPVTCHRRLLNPLMLKDVASSVLKFGGILFTHI